MQTFLPSESFVGSARVLDNKRLGKQRVECLQIWNAIHGKSKGWRHHPATLMWVGHERYLWSYWFACLCEWRDRGFKCSITLPKSPAFTPYPNWLGDQRVHGSHRSNLLRKDPVHYGKYDWKEPDNLPYYWPVTKGDLAVKKVLEFCP
jgi:hypothetical protein